MFYRMEPHIAVCIERSNTHVVAREVVNGSLSEHSVVLELRLAEGRSVGGNDNQLGLAGLLV